MHAEQTPGEAQSTGFFQPDYYDPVIVDLDAFDADGVDLQDSRRHVAASSGRTRGRATARDAAARKPHKIDLVLYTSAASEKSQQAARTIRDVLERYDVSQVEYKVCDLSSRPESGADDSIVFTPTLVKRGPGPRTWVIGSLDPEVLIDLLDTSGVDRRRD
jgi:circadian clock protein KaiB